MTAPKFLLLLKTRVSGYLTRQGSWVDTHYDKRPTRKPKPVAVPSPAPADDESQLSLFSLLDSPSQVAPPPPEATAPPPSTEKPAPAPKRKAVSVDRVALDYDRPWAEIEAMIPDFGAKEDWKPSQRKKANTEAYDVWHMLNVTKGADNEPLTVKDQLRRAARLALSGDIPKDWRKKLAAYSGEGAIGDSLNEYYTPPKVAAAMWYLLRRFGLERGQVLEPCAGTGVFQETKPAGVTMTAVEWSKASAGMNALLHPEDEVNTMAFEHFVGSDATRYDAVIGNPPFGVRGSIAGFDKPDLGKAEDYFVDTCLDKTKEGGLVCLVVPHGIATNATSRSFRKRILTKSEVIGIHRLPNTAFAHAGTGVVTDILLLRKRNQAVANALGVVSDDDLKKVGVWDQPWVDGAILDDPVRGHLHGTAQANWRGGYDVGGEMGHVPAAVATTPIPDLPDQSLSMEELSKALEEDGETYKRALRAAHKNPYPELMLGTTKYINGQLYILHGEPRRWHLASELGELHYDPSSKEGLALRLGDRIKQAVDAVRDGLPVSDLGQLRTDLKAYIKEHGNPQHDKALSALGQQDPRFLPLLASVDTSGRLSDLIEGKTRALAGEEEMDWGNLDQVARELLDGDGRTVTVEELVSRWDGEHSSEEALRHLYASDRYAVSLDGKHWGLREDLTAGELYPKLDAHDIALRSAEEGSTLAEQISRQRQWLLDAIQPKTMEEFEVSLRSGFVPPECLSDYFTFLAQADGRDGRVIVKFEDSVFTFTREEGPSTQWVWFSSWYDKYLNRTNMKEGDWDDIPKREGEFKDWLSTSERWRGAIEEGYNRSFNNFKPKRYGDKPLEIPGWNADRALNAYHFPALRWALEEGKGIISYDVGVGKTPFSIALVAKLREMGQARRPVIVLPKSLTANWAAEIEAFRPGSRVLIIGESHKRDKDGKLVARPDDKPTRDKKWHDITQNDYDYILVTQPAFNEIDVDPIIKGEYTKRDFWVKRSEKLDKASDRKRKEIMDRYEQAMADKDFIKRSQAIYWNHLGVDLLIADEAHGYKNLFTARDRNGEKPKFLGGTGFAKRALDMSHKSQWTRSKQDGKGVFFLTATPTKNSPLEVYSMLSHIAPEAFADRGIRHEEDFIDRYCEIQQRQVLGTGGAITNSPVVTGFKNMDELRSIMGRYIYRKTAEDVGLKLPESSVVEHFIDMTDEQEKVYMELRAEAEDKNSDVHIFSTMDRMAKAAMDLSLLDPVKYSDAESPKYAEAVATIIKHSKEGGQIVFADQVGVHQKVKDRLIAAGMDPKRIGIVNAAEAPDSAKRQNLADAFVNGKLDAIIGNTATMGEGMNLQTRTSDIHDLDIPWDPASLTQRHGRGLRQGNKMGGVRLHTYLSKRSFDGYRWQTMSGKKDWMSQLWSGGDRIENPAAQQGVTSRDEFLIMMADDPIKAKEELDKNKDKQMEKYIAIKKKEASDTFRQYVKAKMNHAALKDQTSKTAQMAKMRIGRLREALTRHEHFKDKALLDLDGPVLINSHGHPFHEGAAFLFEGGGKGPSTSVDPSTWNVAHVDVEKREIRMRPVGHISTSPHDTGETTFSLQDLESGVTPTNPVSAGAELRHLAANLTHPVALKRFPREMIEEHLPAIQDRLRAYMGQESDYTNPDLRDRKELWGIPEGETKPEKIFPGSKDAGKATYLIPNTDLMHSLYDEAIKEEDWNKKYYTPSRGRRHGGYSNYQHRYQSGLDQFHDYDERKTVLARYRKEKEAKQAGMAKSRIVFRLPVGAMS